MKMEKAYQLAKENGYIGQVYSRHGFLLDKEFWVSLGKAMGWKEEVATLTGGKKEECIFVGKKKQEEQWEMADKQPEWLYQWHRFIDHLAERKDPESFF